MPDENGNGRVTMALLGQKLDTLSEDLQEWREEVRRCTQDHEARLRALERQVVQNSQRLGTWAGIQATFTAIAATVAGWLGTRT